MGDLNEILHDFNPEQEAENLTFDPLPAGDYAVLVDGVEIKNTKNLDGKMLNVSLQVVGGEYDKRLAWDSLMLSHPSEKAVRFGRARLAQLCIAANVPGRDSQELLGKVVTATLTVRAADGQYAAKNEVKGYAADGAVAPAPKSEIASVTKRTVYASGQGRPSAEPYEAGGAAAVAAEEYNDEGLPF